MRLTKERLARARSIVLDADASVTVLDALDAYQRVAALRQELVDFMASSNARPKLAIEDVLRKLDRALYGEDAGPACPSSCTANCEHHPASKEPK